MGLRNRDGPTAATFGLTTAGQAVTLAKSEPLQRSWLSCRPTSWSAMQLLRSSHYNRKPALSPSCSYRSPTRLARASSRARYVRAGNTTSFAVFELSLGTKWMGALKQIAPSLKKVTTIFNPKTAPYYSLYLDAIEKAASSF